LTFRSSWMWLQALKEQARLDDLTTVLNFNHHSQHGLQKMTRKNVNHRYLWNSTGNTRGFIK
jgi:hypothetical protein